MSKVMLRYDLIGADKAGYKDHPQKVMKQLGYVVTGYEGIPIADCIMIEVEKLIEPLPDFIEITDFEFTIKK